MPPHIGKTPGRYNEKGIVVQAQHETAESQVQGQFFRLLQKAEGISGGLIPRADSQAALAGLPGTILKEAFSLLFTLALHAALLNAVPSRPRSRQPNYLIAQLARFLPSHFGSSPR